MSEWKDVTSYSRDDRDRIPTSYAKSIGGLRLTITCGHIDDRGNWRVTCRPFFEKFLNKRVENYTAEQVQEIALKMLSDEIDGVNKALASQSEDKE